MNPRRTAGPLGLAVSTLLLAGCAGGQGVTVPPGADQLVACESRQIAVGDLDAVGEPGCDLVGSSLLFPDGTSLTIQPVGDTFSHATGIDADLVEYGILNWGVPGVAATLMEDGRLVEVWASSAEASALQAELLQLDGIDTD